MKALRPGQPWGCFCTFSYKNLKKICRIQKKERSSHYQTKSQDIMRTANITKFQVAKETETAIYINCYTSFGPRACWSLVRVPRTEIHNGVISQSFVEDKKIIVTR